MGARILAARQQLEASAGVLFMAGRIREVTKMAGRIAEDSRCTPVDMSVLIRSALVHARDEKGGRAAVYLMDEFLDQADIPGRMLRDLSDQEIGMCRRIGWPEGERNAFARRSLFMRLGRFGHRGPPKYGA